MSAREPLPADVEALLEAERRHCPPAEAHARVARRLETTLGVALGVATTAAATASAATASAATTTSAATTGAVKATAVVVAKTLAVKLVIGAVGAALVVGGGTYVALHKKSPAAAPSAVAAAHARPNRAPAPVAELAPPVAVEDPAPPVVAATPIHHARVVVEPLIPLAPNPLAEEQAFVEEARAALVGGGPERALRLLDESERRHPSGSFGEARDSLRIQALAAAGHTDLARARADEFRHRFPHSLFQAAVDSSVR